MTSRLAAARRKLLVPSLVALATAAAGGCSEVGTDPSAPVAISFDTLPALAIVEGDTLRDSVGKLAPLTATAFNTAGDTIHGATFSFIARDTAKALVVEPTGAFVFARDSTARATDVTLQASLGALQFTRLLSIVASPDSLAAPTTAVDSAFILGPDTAALRRKNLSREFSVRVLHGSGTSATPVRNWRVDFRVAPVDTTLLDSARVVDANGNFINSANSAGSGDATARLRIYPRNDLGNGLRTGSVVVTATSLAKFGKPIKNDSLKIDVPFAVCTGPTGGC